MHSPTVLPAVTVYSPSCNHKKKKNIHEKDRSRMIKRAAGLYILTFATTTAAQIMFASPNSLDERPTICAGSQERRRREVSTCVDGGGEAAVGCQKASAKSQR